MNPDQERFFQNLQAGDVLLVSDVGDDPMGLPIRVANFYKRGFPDRVWTHAALYVGEGEVVEAFPAGIVKRSVVETYLSNDKYKLMALRRKNLDAGQIKTWADFCVGELSAKYDFRALAYFALYVMTPTLLLFVLDIPQVERLFKVDGSYFCSELVAAGLQQTGDYCFERVPCRVMPVDFLNSLIFEKLQVLVPPKLPGIWPKAARFIARVGGVVFYVLMVPLGFVLSMLFLALAVILLFIAGVWFLTKSLLGVFSRKPKE